MTCNLYAEIYPDGRVHGIIMPRRDGTLPPAPSGNNWYAVQWPTDPHNTGERVIRAMLTAGFPLRQPA